MKPRKLTTVAGLVGGSVIGGSDPLVTGVAVDSREVRPGDLFFALPGERVDGHTFVGRALDAGAAGAVVRGGRAVVAGPLIEVEDPAAALLELAAHARDDLTATVVAITGSTGKTLTKDLTSGVLARRYRVVASAASFNNEVGLPLTVLGAPPETEAMVCEMGSRGRGHIALLCRVARPQIGVVTNVGVAHLELFGTPEVLREAKAELPESLPEDGTAILNADDPVVRTYGARTQARRVVWFGSSPEAEVRANSIEVSRETGRASFDLETPDGSARVGLPVPGEHLIADALAAAAVGWVLGVPIEATAAGLEGAALSGGRMETVDAGGVRIVNDAYNANPTSMASALKAAKWMAGEGRCIAVLGHMAELGPIADAEHERVGELVARLGVEMLVVVGEEARLIAVGAQREGVEPDRIYRCDGWAQAAATVDRLARPGDLVLVKASRVARLERIAEALIRGAERREPSDSPQSTLQEGVR